ncbi:unnamed protein product [Allacma fusca]|uniref:STI1 domain-containing protein n=1 Tax=Allacma fusca TaxID=39272 RepID=A0A8J2KN66_9HEXA|nr:unnamed protein product [Allacma fusca]
MSTNSDTDRNSPVTVSYPVAFKPSLNSFRKNQELHYFRVMSKVICYVVLTSWALTMVLVSASPTGGWTSYPRMNRGFKNAQLSTARGFGKRDSDGVRGTVPEQEAQQHLERLEEILSANARSSHPNPRLMEVLQRNPEIARLMVERFIAGQSEGEWTSDELSRG